MATDWLEVPGVYAGHHRGTIWLKCYGRERAFPKSQIRDYSHALGPAIRGGQLRKGDEISIAIPRWLARDRGISF